MRASLPRLYAIATLILRDQDRAQDAVQEALVLAWRHVRALRDPEAWDAWLYRTTVRACYRHARQQKRRDLVELHVEPDPERPGAVDLALSVVERDRLGRELGRLPIDQRAVMVLHFYLDLPLTEAAEILEIPVRHRQVPSSPRPARPAERHGRRAGGHGPQPGAIGMTTDSRMERDITDALDAEVAGSMPADLEHDILATTGRMRPLPRWLALLKEPPMRIHHRVAVGSPTVRLIGVMALTIALALATAGAVAVGASLLPEPPKPPPFGTAVTGSMYYSQDGDIYRAEPGRLAPGRHRDRGHQRPVPRTLP